LVENHDFRRTLLGSPYVVAIPSIVCQPTERVELFGNIYTSECVQFVFTFWKF